MIFYDTRLMWLVHLVPAGTILVSVLKHVGQSQQRAETPLTHFEATAPVLKLISIARGHAAVMYVSQTKAH